MKPKYKIGDTVYYSKEVGDIDSDFLSDSLIIDIVTNGEVIREAEIIEVRQSSFTNCFGIFPCYLYKISEEDYCYPEEELTTNKQDLINKVKDIIIEMESNIQKVKNELGIK